MLYMVIERYLHGPGPVYERAASRGRMLPDGLEYVSSWVVDDAAMDRCFQLMETTEPELFGIWFERWRDLVSFEVFPVLTSAEAAARAAPEQLPASWRPRFHPAYLAAGIILVAEASRVADGQVPDIQTPITGNGCAIPPQHHRQRGSEATARQVLTRACGVPVVSLVGGTLLPDGFPVMASVRR
jgi:hypothetical protein